MSGKRVRENASALEIHQSIAGATLRIGGRTNRVALLHLLVGLERNGIDGIPVVGDNFLFTGSQACPQVGHTS